MTTLKKLTINEIIRTEGGYVNDPSDSGGETKYGITKAVALSYGYTGEMIDFPRYLAVKIYEDWYWNAVKGDRLVYISEDVAKEVVDTGVNMGVARAVIFLQRSLNAFNLNGQYYADLSVDGLMGSKTLTALEDYLMFRGDEGERVLTNALNCLQGAAYIELAENREKDEKYVYGWLRSRVKLS